MKISSQLTKATKNEKMKSSLKFLLMTPSWICCLYSASVPQYALSRTLTKEK